MGSQTQKRSMGDRIRGAVGGVSMKKNSKSSDRNIEPVARSLSTLGHEPQLSSYVVKTVFNQSQVRRCSTLSSLWGGGGCESSYLDDNKNKWIDVIYVSD